MIVCIQIEYMGFGSFVWTTGWNKKKAA